MLVVVLSDGTNGTAFAGVVVVVGGDSECDVLGYGGYGYGFGFGCWGVEFI